MIASSLSRSHRRSRRALATAVLLLSQLASIGAADWPTHRADNARSASVETSLELPLALAWTFSPDAPPAPAWPPPARRDIWNKRENLEPRVTYDRAFHVVGHRREEGARIYFGSSSDHQLRCLDLTSGEILWSFFAEAPIRASPSLSSHGVHFGADDGLVYTLRFDGTLVWRHEISPGAPRIVGNDALISPTPIRTGVLVDEDTLHLCAGIFPAHGAWRVALDARTGRELARVPLEISPQGYLTQVGDRLVVRNGRASKPAEVSRLERRGTSNSAASIEIPERYPDSSARAGETLFAGGDGAVAAFDLTRGEKLWTAPVHGIALGLAIVETSLLVSTDTGAIHCFRAATAPDVASVAPEETSPRQETRSPAPPAPDRSLVSSLERGWCVLVEPRESPAARAVLESPALHVVSLESDPTIATQVRARLSARGAYGSGEGRTAVARFDGERLPIADWIANRVVVFPDALARLRPEEAARCVRPGGELFIARPDAPSSARWHAWMETADHFERDPRLETPAWVVLRRSPPRGAGEWTHLYANAANTTSSEDRVANGPLRLQWFGAPGPREMIDRHHRTSAPLASDGRLFIPADERIFAVDAYNGTALWTREIPGARRLGVGRDCGNLALAADRLHVAAGSQLLALDVANGEPVASYLAPGPVGERDWGWVACDRGRVHGSSSLPRVARTELGRATIDEIYNDHQGIVTSDAVFAYTHTRERAPDSGSDAGDAGDAGDASAGDAPTPAWIHRPDATVIANPTLTLSDRSVIFIEAPRGTGSGRVTLRALLGAGATLVSLDAATGATLWRETLDLHAIEHAIHVVWTRGRIIVVGSRNAPPAGAEEAAEATVWFDVQVHDDRTGTMLWKSSRDSGARAGGNHGEKDYHPVVVGERLIVEPFAFELSRGDELADWGWRLSGKRRGCGTISASSRTLFFRDSSPASFDLETRTHGAVTRVTRPGCWINIIPAGGLVLVPEASSGCTCEHPVQTSLALAPLHISDL